MSERQIRAWLRGATAARVLDGWYVVGRPGARTYIVNPGIGPTQSFDATGAMDYCELLWAAGVEPVYRSSEPDFEAVS